MAMLMRIQLSHANAGFLTKGAYNEVVTMHGTAMVFLFVVPVLAGFGNYLVPLMIGARDMAFPRLNAASYWLFLLGGLVLLSSFLADQGGAQCGWTSYTPCSSEQFSPGHGQDLWILGIHLTGISSILGAINFIVTIHNMRAPGMTWMRIPLFTWAIEAYAVLLVLVLPTIAAAATLLLLDRQAGTAFFAPENGGPVLWQHMFWFFGHPEVYIMVLPAMGILSEVIPVFSRKPIFGYKAVAFSTIGIAFASMLVWAHHMFTIGMPTYLQALLRGHLARRRHPDGREDLQLARDPVEGEPHLPRAAPVRARLHRPLHDGRALRDHPRRLPRRLPGAGLLLRRRAPALRALRRDGLRGLCRRLLLVPEDDREDVQRAPCAGALLAPLRRLQRRLPAHSTCSA